VQTYIPYLFLVIPLGPVTLTGQVTISEITISAEIFFGKTFFLLA
jgi:hypothetical protein